MMDFRNIDILSASDFTRGEIEHILDTAEYFLPVALKQKKSNLLDGKLMAALFYEPSTRTRFSFEAAMNRLGGRVITAVGIEYSSLAKGETLYDTGKMMEKYVDVIVIRHPQPGSAREIALSANVPVISAGDGIGEHPTQAFLDLFTIRKECGTINNLTVAMVGDLKYGRTVHSLALLLSNYKIKLIFVSPKQLKISDDVKQHLKNRKIPFEETESLETAMQKADVVYNTRIQKERFTDTAEYERFKNCYVFNRKLIEKYNSKIVLMHPLPRVGEVDPDVDDLAGAAYFRQAQNGVTVRMALLALVLGVKY